MAWGSGNEPVATFDAIFWGSAGGGAGAALGDGK